MHSVTGESVVTPRCLWAPDTPWTTKCQSLASSRIICTSLAARSTPPHCSPDTIARVGPVPPRAAQRYFLPVSLCLRAYLTVCLCTGPAWRRTHRLRHQLHLPPISLVCSQEVIALNSAELWIGLNCLTSFSMLNDPCCPRISATGSMIYIRPGLQPANNIYGKTRMRRRANWTIAQRRNELGPSTLPLKEHERGGGSALSLDVHESRIVPVQPGNFRDARLGSCAAGIGHVPGHAQLILPLVLIPCALSDREVPIERVPPAITSDFNANASVIRLSDRPYRFRPESRPVNHRLVAHAKSRKVVKFRIQFRRGAQPELVTIGDCTFKRDLRQKHSLGHCDIHNHMDWFTNVTVSVNGIPSVIVTFTTTVRLFELLVAVTSVDWFTNVTVSVNSIPSVIVTFTTTVRLFELLVAVTVSGLVYKLGLHDEAILHSSVGNSDNQWNGFTYVALSVNSIPSVVCDIVGLHDEAILHSSVGNSDNQWNGFTYVALSVNSIPSVVCDILAPLTNHVLEEGPRPATPAAMNEARFLNMSNRLLINNSSNLGTVVVNDESKHSTFSRINIVICFIPCGGPTVICFIPCGSCAADPLDGHLGRINFNEIFQTSSNILRVRSWLNLVQDQFDKLVY
ncbi:hypothetical protein J6590_027108 [Homalodisca vitripennis]|nr:hypothetical protein J6590_027108 [Homalodisca vitripennis]